MNTKHTNAREEFLKKLDQSKKDCELDFIDIVNHEEKRIKEMNKERKDKMTHGHEHFRGRELSEKFKDDMKRFQRVLQIQFE